jgi:Na+-transporting methylmalonyl-CoA/oxaloacetate decarboxylase gamma subunit
MSNMLLALEITALGMGIVFAAIILIWWMMSLLTSITADRTPPSAPAATHTVTDNDLKARAAAVAVALALAEQQTCTAHLLADPPTAVVSAWQLGMRTRQLYEKRAPTIHKSRKAG